MNRDRILILGVTASGKGKLAFNLAVSLDAEIISVDSMKVYRRMDIGTSKPPRKAREQIKHHLIDIIEPSDSFSAGVFVNAAQQAMEQIRGSSKSVIAVGGTALYIKALLYGIFQGPGADEKLRAELHQRTEEEGLAELHKELKSIDPLAGGRINPNDAKRIIRALEVHRITGKPISYYQKQWETTNLTNDWTIIGLRRNKAEENKRINARTKKMIQAGLIDEVKSLLAEEKPLSKQARSAIGYAEIIDHLAGRMSLEDAIELIKKNTRKLAKNQRTWFKTFKNVYWLDIHSKGSEDDILSHTKKILFEQNRPMNRS
jgi:tRNA dimethylallyltransferase